MAFSLNAGGSRGRRAWGTPALSEINVTPFVDVVLVLLIIFMLTAHVMEYGMEVDVPKTKATRTSTKELPVVTITKAGAIYLNRDEININLLSDTIHQRFGNPAGVYVRADRETPFDPIAQVVSVLGDAKLPVNLVTQPDDSAGARQR